MLRDVKTLMAAFWALGAAGCTGSALDTEPGLPVVFGCECQCADDSRGEVTTASNMDVFAVSATAYSPTGQRSLCFAHEEYGYRHLGQQVYRTVGGGVHYWQSEDDEYNFFAYTPSPYITFPQGEVSKFVYTTPKDAALQPDIMVAVNIAATYGQPVALRFSHPLVRVSLYEDAASRRGRILTVAFSGIIDHGEYDMLTGEWLMLASDTDAFVWECNAVCVPGTSLTGEYHNFFFIPQELGPQAALTVVYRDALGVVVTRRVRLAGQWQAGHHYRYSLML